MAKPNDDYLREIGRIAVSWNDLESLMLHTLILALMGDHSWDGKALAALVHMNVPQLRQALRSVLRIVNEDIAKVYREDIDGLIEKAQTKRNEAVHQAWHWQAEGISRFDVRARSELTITSVQVKLQDLIDVTSFIDKTRFRLAWEICELLDPNRPDSKLVPQQGQ